jgi:dedicator of cytokinesis protein 3
MPPSVVRDQVTPSPTWRRSPIAEITPPRGNIAGSLTNGTAVVEEASAARPISVRQRGARLSFLGAKRKDSQPSNGEATTPTHTNGDTPTNGQATKSKDNANRRSFFRTQPSVGGTTTSSEPGPLHWLPEQFSRKSEDVVDVMDRGSDGDPDGLPLMKKASLRKRFSTLKLGNKRSKTALLGGLAEQD